MKRSKTLAWVLCFFAFSGLAAQTPETEDLLTVTAGFSHVMERFWDDHAESGKNLDGSLLWTVTEDETVLELNNYRFYFVDMGDSETVSLTGRLLLANGLLNGKLSVAGIDFPEIRFSDLALFEDPASADRPCISIGGDSYTWNESEEFLSWAANLSRNKIIDAEKESLLVFLFSFSAPSILSWEDGGRLFPYSREMPPKGEFTRNPSMSLCAVSLGDGIKFIYQDFQFTDSIFPLAPLLKGSFDMRLPPEENEGTYLTSLDGTIEAKNMRFVRSLRYDACIVTDDIGMVSGTVSIDGRPCEFAEFAAILDNQF
ncbi:MAG: hypothetical protein LBH73_03925 [Spirochaetaceae bacterium]|jgi:hypothetical protein|nr:hypothetical protein [Spirochaetaceae bacterium]